TAPAARAEAVSSCGDSERQRHLLRGLTIRPGTSVALSPEELDPPPHRVRRALRPVSARPLAEHQPPADCDLAAFGEMVGAGLGLASERGHVDVGRLALLTSAAGVVDRDAQLADR